MHSTPEGSSQAMEIHFQEPAWVRSRNEENPCVEMIRKLGCRAQDDRKES